MRYGAIISKPEGWADSVHWVEVPFVVAAEPTGALFGCFHSCLEGNQERPTATCTEYSCEFVQSNYQVIVTGP